MHELLQKSARHHDRDAFAAFFRHFAPRIRGYYLRGGVARDIADELLQEVMLRVWRGASTYESERGSIESWMFRIARNVRIDRRKKERYCEVEAGDPALLPAPPERPDEAALATERASRLQEALASLPSEQAAALRSMYFGQKTAQAIADEEAVPVGTVKSRLRLGFQHLRAALSTEVD